MTMNAPDPFGAGPIPGAAESPMANIQSEVASVLNAGGSGNNIYIPLQDQVGQPIVQVPNFRQALSQFVALFRSR